MRYYFIKHRQSRVVIDSFTDEVEAKHHYLDHYDTKEYVLTRTKPISGVPGSSVSK